MTAIYVERYLNYGLTREELQSGRPIIGIAQTGSDLAPCNRHHLALAERVKAGIRDAGGIPMEFPVHPLAEQGRRPTAALDRNLAYLGLVEILHGYPLDGVVLTTGCDKTTPLPDGRGHRGHSRDRAVRRTHAGRLARRPARGLGHGDLARAQPDGGGQARLRRLHDAGDRVLAVRRPLQHHGHGAVDELAGRGAGHVAADLRQHPAPYRERGQMAYATGKRICDMVREDMRPSRILTREAFENAIVVASALGASSNCPPHLIAMARHAGIDLSLDDWQRLGETCRCWPTACPPASTWARAFTAPAACPPCCMNCRPPAGCTTAA